MKYIIGFIMLMFALQIHAQSKEQAMSGCRQLAMKTAPLIIKLRESREKIPAHQRPNPVFTEVNPLPNDSKLSSAYGGAQDYMWQSFERNPSLTERELITIGYSYCVQRLPY
jgi:hypothetical protein